MFWPSASNRFPIDVAVHGTTVSHLTQLVGDLHVADVTGVPHLIAALCVAEDAFVHVSMGVRKKHNLHGVRAKSVEMPTSFHEFDENHFGGDHGRDVNCGQCGHFSIVKPSKKAQKPLQRPWKRTGFVLRFGGVAFGQSHPQKPEYAEAWFLKAQIYQDMDHPQLEATLVQALALDANLFPHGWVELAHVQWELGKYEEGLASLERLDALGMSRLAGDALTKREWVEAGLRFSVDAVDATDALQEASPMRGQLNTAPGVLWCA